VLGCLEVVLVLDHPRSEAVAEDMPVAVVAQVEPLGVDPVQHVHARGEIRAGRLDHEVVVRAHEAEGEATPREALGDMGKKRQESEPIPVVEEDQLLSDASSGHMEEPVRKRSPKKPCHDPDGTRRAPRRAHWG
jgi:hypothetical protein